ncbi:MULTISPECIES: hypothetical protein [Microvirga]|uniref:hypothetical protein n=1 Tax=Microvirga TaxID=186650 RepID=UPI001CFDC630|nr:hypothetical protein [Microvirga lenta]MCB5174718.1 hypothetical protein [Microvirga lenta]
MLKIHPGIKAIAILAGPAALIVGYHSVSQHFERPRPYDPRTAQIMWRIYEKCTELPKLQRTVRCDEYVTYFEGCAKGRHGCSLASSHALLARLDFDLPPLRLLVEEVTVTHASSP